MSYLIYAFLEFFFIFFFGCLIGSFFNVVAYRVSKEENFVTGRSKCEQCHRQIAWYDNIPLLSFLLLKGKCRYCQAKISLVHPLFEVLTGLLFFTWYTIFFHGQMIATFQSGYIYQALFYLAFFALLWLIFISDLLYYLIPNVAVLALFVLYLGDLLLSFFFGNFYLNHFLLAVLMMLLFTGLFFCFWYFSQGKAFGFGDVKLMIPMALILAYPRAIVGVFSAFILGAIIGIILIIFKKKNRKQLIPFGPFLVLGSFIAYFYGQQIWNWYLSLL